MAKPKAAPQTPAHAVAVPVLDPKNRTPMTEAELIAAHNEWMRRYVEEPERFESEFKLVQLFLAEEAAGRTPSYGEDCTAYLQVLRSHLRAEGRL